MVTANMRQVEGIIGVSTEPIRRLIRGAPMYGQSIEVTAEQDHFASMGALYLFGSVLDQFFGVYSSMHTFTRFQIKEPITGETFTWPERMGTKWLI
jgi:type VI secretion system protein ImpG